MTDKLYENQYNPTHWIDHIVDPTLPENDPNRIVQQGTRFTASRANNIEDGIVGIYNHAGKMYEDIVRMRAEIETLGRAPVNNGSFLDVLDGSGERNIKQLNNKAVAQTAISSGATSIALDVAPFSIGSYVTVYDGTKHEDVKITAVSGTTITVSATANAYPKGASVAQSSAVVADNKLMHGAWGTYSVTVKEVI